MCQHFSEGHFSIKMGSKGPKLLDFSKFIIKLSEIKKKCFFFTVFWGYLEGAGTLFLLGLKSPALLELNIWTLMHDKIKDM